MIDFDIVAYAMLGVSLSVSAVQVGRWLLSANPRAIINAGRWLLAGLVALTPLALLWLVISGRATLAMMFAAFVLPGRAFLRAFGQPPQVIRRNARAEAAA
jgi:hypothetical protein